MARLRFTLTIVVMLFVFCVGVTASAQTTCPPTGTCYYVNGTCATDGSGTSPICDTPNGPKRTIQAAINLTQSGDTVIVANGSYTPTDTDNDQVRCYALQRINGLVQNITVGSASGQPENCIIDCNPAGTQVTPCRAFDFYFDNATRDAVIEGFTIRGGYINTGSHRIGGGIRIVESSPTIRGCVIESNTVVSSEGGGGIGITSKNMPNFSPLIKGCIIR